MKKLFYLLLVLPFALMITSCSSDDDLPNVDVTVSFLKAAEKNGIVYAVKDNGLDLLGITTRSVDGNKDSALVNVLYYWNTFPAPGLTFGIFPMEINLAELPLRKMGANVLSFNGELLEVDKSIAYFYVNIPIVVVNSEEELPEGLTLGRVSLTYRTASSDN